MYAYIITYAFIYAVIAVLLLCVYASRPGVMANISITTNYYLKLSSKYEILNINKSNVLYIMYEKQKNILYTNKKLHKVKNI